MLDKEPDQSAEGLGGKEFSNKGVAAEEKIAFSGRSLNRPLCTRRVHYWAQFKKQYLQIPVLASAPLPQPFGLHCTQGQGFGG